MKTQMTSNNLKLAKKILKVGGHIPHFKIYKDGIIPI